MGEFLRNLFTAGGLGPPSPSGSWTQGQLWLHMVADMAVFITYVAVPGVVAYLVAGRRDLKVSRAFWILLTIVFAAGGIVHFIQAINVWWPAYRFLAIAKLLTAIVSAFGFILLARHLLHALSQRSDSEIGLARTRQQFAEESLQRERELLHTILEYLPDYIYFKDRDGRYLRIGRTLANRLGISDPAKAIGTLSSDWFPEQFAKAVEEADRQVLRTGQPWGWKEQRPQWPDGTSSHVLTTKCPHLDRDGHVIGTFGISHDVTELKNTERALRESEHRFDLAVRGTSDGIWDWNPPTNEVYYSPRFRQLLGYDEDEFPNDFDAWQSRLHADDLPAVMEALEKHLHDRTTYDVEYRLQTKHQSYRWFRARGQAVWNEAGEAIRMAGSITDVTDRKDAEDALKSSQRLYLSLVETLPVHLIRKDYDGKFTFANRAFCRLVNRSLDDILGTTDFDYFPAELAQKYRRDDQWVMETGQHFEDIEENDDGDQRRFFQVIKTPVYGANGKVDGTQAIFWDVTDRKMAETALQAAKEAAEDANRAKSEFLANMSHEIRTPMNAVIGLTELLLETHLTPHQRDCLSTVLDAGESLLTIINQILDFSKIESGQVELERSSFELRELVGNTMKTFAARGNRKGLELAWRVDEDVPDRLLGDRTRLRQILINLVGNAIKFTEEGEVVVAVSVEQRRGNDDVQLCFSVRDTGIGIAPEKRDSIFHAFQQADTSTTREYGGTGLGLAIVVRLAELMDGRVWLESEVGRGSTFHFSARLGVDSSTPADTVLIPEVMQARPVLVVDDNATNRQILEEVLTAWGIAVRSVGSGQECLACLHDCLATESTLPLVVTDMNMPHMDGLQLAHQIRADDQLRDVVVVMLTSGAPGDGRVVDGSVIAAQLLKPVKQSELFDTLATVTGATRPSQLSAAAKAASGGRPAKDIPPLRVLLAEDGLANRKLALGVLQSWGHQVEAVTDGQQAVEAWARHEFDLILMDVQMPVLDGLQATREIRRQEIATERRHTLIIAMTAHAMDGDREKCLAAGMDEYISKPVRKKLLQATIEGLWNTAPAGEQPTICEDPMSLDDRDETSGQALDLSTALAATGGDEALMRDVLEAMAAEIPMRLRELEQALSASDAPSAQRAAHTIKGTMRLFPHSPVRALAENIELLAAKEELPTAAQSLPELDSTCQRFLQELRKVLHN